jgi:hypothetical protein
MKAVYGDRCMDVKNAHHPGSPSVKKFKTVPSAKKVMLTKFGMQGACFTRNF